MKQKNMLAAAIAAVGLSGLFNDAVFAPQRMNLDPFKHSRRGSHTGPVHRVYCRQCERAVSKDKRHRCIARYIPAPRHGWRYESGQLVRRSQA